jgi:hypothetical protein
LLLKLLLPFLDLLSVLKELEVEVSVLVGSIKELVVDVPEQGGRLRCRLGHLIRHLGGQVGYGDPGVVCSLRLREAGELSGVLHGRLLGRR